MQPGLGLTRNRHGNQFHTRICVPKDLAPQLGRKEIRISLGTEQRRYAIQAARLIHARKITAFDELRVTMNKNNSNPAPEQQAEARNHLLTLIQQRLHAEAHQDLDEDAESIRLAQEAEARYTQEADQEAQKQLEREKTAASLAPIVPDPEDREALSAVFQDMAQKIEHAQTAQQATVTELQTARKDRNTAIQIAETHANEAKAAHQQRQQAQDEHTTTVERMATEHSAQLASVAMAALARSGTEAAPDADKILNLPISVLAQKWINRKEKAGGTSKEKIKRYERSVRVFIWQWAT